MGGGSVGTGIGNIAIRYYTFFVRLHFLVWYLLSMKEYIIYIIFILNVFTTNN